MRNTSLARALVALVLLAWPVASQAQFTVYTNLAAFLAATTSAGTDSFNDLSITGSTPTPLARSAGAFSYTATVNTTTFYGAGSGTDHWLSANTATDVIRFSGFSSSVRGVGGFFFGTDVSGAFRSGSSVIVRATNAAGTTSQTVVDATLGTFLGFVSTTDIFSLTVETVLPATGFAWPTVNDLVLAAAPTAGVVPEPATYALLSAGLLVVGVVAKRRRRN